MHRSPTSRRINRRSLTTNTTRSAIESLEGRRLLSVAVSNGILTITGSGGNDTYFVNRSGTNVTVTENGGAAKLFALSSVSRINASLGNGNDQITVANVLTIPTSVNGGDGADGIVTGGGDDTLDGGIGDDYLDGRDGLDTVTYASRTAPVSAHLDVSYTPSYTSWNRPDTIVINRSGSGGAAGENDAFASVETLTGGSGNDAMYITGGYFGYSGEEGEVLPAEHAMRVNGGGGDDTVTASPTQAGPFGSYSFFRVIADGGDGNDTLRSGLSNTGNTTLRGGAGDDYFRHGTDDYAVIEPGEGYDTYSRDTNVIRTYTMPAGLEKFIAENGADSITGNELDNWIVGGAGHVDGRGGNDFIETTSYHAFGTVLGGDGNDTITASNYAERIEGGDGDDVITLDHIGKVEGAPRISVSGGAGADRFFVVGDVPNVTFDGDADADSLTIDTTNSSNGLYGSTAYRLDLTTLIVESLQPGPNGPGTYVLESSTLEYLDIGTINLTTGNRDDGVVVLRLLPSKTVNISTGDGYDGVRIEETPASSTVTLIDGSGYYDHLSINSNGVGSAAVTLSQAATFHTVSMGSGGSLTLTPSANEANSVRIIHPDIRPGAIIELNNNAMIVDADGPEWEPQFMTQLTDRLREGRNGGAWNGVGIRSSTAASTPRMTLGIARSADLFTSFPATIAGQSVDNTAIIIRYTRNGDMNLDRQVNFADLVILAQNYNKTGRTYAQGNLDYSTDGRVDFADLVLLAQNYNTTASSVVASAAAPAVKRTTRSA